MHAVYEWIRSLVFYAVLVTLIMNLLPDRKYEKYLRFFTGMVFVLLVFEPVASVTGLEEPVASAYARLTMQDGGAAGELKREIAMADEARMNRLQAEYDRAVAMAAQEAMAPAAVSRGSEEPNTEPTEAAGGIYGMEE